jgi:hypothetical protein
MANSKAGSVRLLLVLLLLALAGLACNTLTPTVSDEGEDTDVVAATEPVQDVEDDNDGADEPDATATPEPAVEATEPGADGERSATLEFEIASATFDAGGDASYLEQGCWPPSHNDDGKGYLTVGATGGLQGECAHSEGGVEVIGDAFGIWGLEAGDAANFRVTTVIITSAPDGATGETRVTITYDALGEVVGDVAESSASFAYTCEASGDLTCPNGEQSQALYGGLPFRMELTPAP